MTNPGTYQDVHLNCTRNYVRALCGPTPPYVEPVNPATVFALAAALAVLAAIVTASIIVNVRVSRKAELAVAAMTPEQRRTRKLVPSERLSMALFALSLLSAFVGFAVIGGLSAAVTPRTISYHHHSQLLGFTFAEGIDKRGVNYDKYERAASLNGYKGRVQKWLASNYGITVNKRAVSALMRDGHQVAVTYEGEQVAIELLTAQDGGLAVRQTGGQVLEPIR